MTKDIVNKKTKLYLTLERFWFDMILSGKKLEEYRTIKKYWVTRLTNKTFEEILSTTYIDGYQPDIFKKYDSIVFSHGYRKDRDQFEIELLNIKVATGKEEWGAEEGVLYFVLELGNIINKNIKSKKAA